MSIIFGMNNLNSMGTNDSYVKKAKIGSQAHAEYHHIPILTSITKPNLT